MKPAAFSAIAVGLFLIAGGVYFLTGLGLVISGLWCSGRAQSSMSEAGASDAISAAVALLGGLGAVALVSQFVIERLTALP